MTEWYESSFGYDYLELYAHRDEAEAQADIHAIIDLLSPPRNEPLLDLCCGACRHLLVLREMGFSQLVGLDLSEELLRVGAERLKQPDAGTGSDGVDVRLVRSDMRIIPYENHFSTVLSLFTSFGYFGEDEENQAVLDAVYRCLRPGGRLLMDYLNRDYVVAHLVERDEASLPDRCRRVEKTTTVTARSGKRREFHESVRMYSQAEMLEMLSSAGFADIYCYGSLTAQACDAESKRLILIAEKGMSA